MAKTVEKFYDLGRLSKIFEGELTNSMAQTVENLAKNQVARDTGALQRSIRTIADNPTNYTVFSDLVYAAAQEYGLAPYGKPGYRPQPYMRPAAATATTGSNVKAIVNEAIQKAIIGSTV